MPTPLLNPNFRDMLLAFFEAEARYLLVGAYAMAVHGCPRATGDIDFWVEPSPENAQRVWSALVRFGAPLGSVQVSDFHAPDVVFQMGLPPQRIDLLTSISGLNFAEAWPQRLVVPIDGLEVSVIGREELRRNKLSTGRPKDEVDAAILAKYNE